MISNGNKIILAIKDLIKIISISVKLEEHNFTKVDIKEKNKEAKHIKIIPLISGLIFLKNLSIF